MPAPLRTIRKMSDPPGFRLSLWVILLCCQANHPALSGLKFSSFPEAFFPQGSAGRMPKAAGKAKCTAKASNRHASRGPSRGASHVAPPKPAPDLRSAAATRIQARFRGILGRLVVVHRRMRLEQERAEAEHCRRVEARRLAAEKARRQAEEEARAREVQQREEKLRALRERRCALEQMCQGLSSHHMDWEETPSKLLDLLERNTPGIGKLALSDAWLGSHSERRSARKRYLLLARKWHPDKWAVQGALCVSIATEVAKRLVMAYEQACKELPNVAPPATSSYAQEDNDEDRECYEFASWVGISFKGMEEVWRERRGVKR